MARQGHSTVMHATFWRRRRSAVWRLTLVGSPPGSRVPGTARMATIDELRIHAFEIPTDEPESDGTLSWDATTIIVVEARSGATTGIGYSYGDKAIAQIVDGKLRSVVVGADALAPGTCWGMMCRAVRNSLASGLCGYAISAVDIALHDLKARLLDLSVADLLGRWHDGVAIYGSGGFTSYTHEQLQAQAAGWMASGLTRVKVKVARDPDADADRLAAVRDVVGPDVRLMVDANGAFAPAEALAAAHDTYAACGVTWFEEPVSSDDHTGLRRVRDRVPPGMQVTAGEYGTDLFHFERLFAAEAVDVLQPDVTRCGGVTGVVRTDALAKAHCVPISAHCAPAVSAHVFAACETTAHLEYFHDHVRVESLLFDGTLAPTGGRLVPRRDQPGFGLELKRTDAERYRVGG
jgi:L-alanine-DL-glutamate epimerase-like enolase superfamily enzyme